MPLGVKYDEISERIKVRLGRDHSVTLAYVAAGEAFLEVWKAVDRVAVLYLPQLDGDGRGGTQVLAFISQERATVVIARQRFDAKRVEFVDAAARVAGVRLRSR